MFVKLFIKHIIKGGTTYLFIYKSSHLLFESPVKEAFLIAIQAVPCTLFPNALSWLLPLPFFDSSSFRSYCYPMVSQKPMAVCLIRSATTISKCSLQ